MQASPVLGMHLYTILEELDGIFYKVLNILPVKYICLVF